jgi:hypothetical protein
LKRKEVLEERRSKSLSWLIENFLSWTANSLIKRGTDQKEINVLN